MLKNKIFQYFFTEFFKIFLLISLSFSLLIWFTQAARLLELITDLGGRTYFEKRKNSPWERQFYKRVLNILIDDLEEKQKPENKEDFKIWEGV